jgi:hypothetical protein
MGAAGVGLVLESGAGRGLIGVLAGASSSADGKSKMSGSAELDTTGFEAALLVGTLTVLRTVFWAPAPGAAGVVPRDLVFLLTEFRSAVSVRVVSAGICIACGVFARRDRAGGICATCASSEDDTVGLARLVLGMRVTGCAGPSLRNGSVILPTLRLVRGLSSSEAGNSYSSTNPLAGAPFFFVAAAGRGVGSLSDGTSKTSSGVERLGHGVWVLFNVLLAFVGAVALTVASAVVACLRGRSGDGASSCKFCGAVKRADRPYVTTFLRRSGIVKVAEAGDAMTGGCAVATGASDAHHGGERPSAEVDVNWVVDECRARQREV